MMGQWENGQDRREQRDKCLEKHDATTWLFGKDMKEYWSVEASSWNSQYIVPLFSKNLMEVKSLTRRFLSIHLLTDATVKHCRVFRTHDLVGRVVVIE